MLETKNHKSVIDKTYQKMVEEISSGTYKPGERLPGDRELSKIYGIGRSSIINVLKKLQEERYVERIPVYGTFIREDLPNRYQVLSIALVSPNQNFTPEVIGFSSWSTIMEILRGILEESSSHIGVRSTILHCEDTTNPTKLRAQLDDLREFDGIIFCGPTLTELKKQFFLEKKPAVVVAAKPQDIPEIYPSIYINTDRSIVKMANYVKEKANNKPILLVHWQVDDFDKKRFQNEIKLLTSQLDRLNATYEIKAIDKIVTEQDNPLSIVESIFPNPAEIQGKAIWCLNRLMVPALNHLILKYQSDALLFGAPSSHCYPNIYPTVPFLLEPYYQMGKIAIAQIIDNLTSNTPINNQELEPIIYCGSEPIL